MTIISDLSWDLVENIFSRVPIIDIGAVRSTCKQWNRLSKEQVWCKAEARRHQFLRFMVKNFKLCSMRFDLHGILDGEEFVDPSIKEITAIDSLNHVKVTQVFHCDGLFLCVTKDKDEENKTSSLVVWNPYLGQTRWIQAKNYYGRLDLYALGYGSSNNHRTHKILRFWDTGLSFNVCEYEIYDISSDSWRVLDITQEWDIMFYHRGVSLKGNTYFLAKTKILFKDGPAEPAEPHAILLSFDFTKERFGPPLPLPFEHYIEDTGTLSSINDEKLAALYQSTSMSSDVEIWVTTKIKPHAVSWVPFLKVYLEPFTGFGFQFHFVGASFFIDEEKKVAVVFEMDESETNCYDTAYLIGENDYFEKVSLGEAEKHKCSYKNVGEYCPLVCSCSYVPSLVHINNEFAGIQNLKS